MHLIKIYADQLCKTYKMYDGMLAICQKTKKKNANRNLK